MNFKGYKAGSIIGSTFNTIVSLKDIEFTVTNDHRTYLSCPGNINAKIAS